jgi:hypothetical protein
MARQSEDRNGAHDDQDHDRDQADDEHGSNGETQAERLRRRAAFLRDLAEMKELRARVRPRRTRVAKLREARRRATYRSS